MACLVTTPRFRSDTSEILDQLEKMAGPRVAATYGSRFGEAVVRLARFPESGAPRPALGANTRIAIVQPQLLIYDFTSENDTLTLLRILHGRRSITLDVLGR